MTTVDPNMMRFLVELAEVIDKHSETIANTHGMYVGLTVDLAGDKYATYYEEGWDFE